MQQRPGRTSNGATSRRRPRCGSDRWSSSRTWCDATSTTSRSRTSTDPALHTLFRAKRDEIARQITALEDRDTSRFVYGSLQLYGGIAQPLASAAEELLETIPARAPSTRERHGRRVRGGGSCGVRSIPCRVSGLPGSHRGARRHLRADGVVRPAAHPRSRRLQGGPRRALAASRGRHPCRHLPERRQATTDAADDRTAWLRRDPRGPCRARRVPDRRIGPAASPRARGAGCRRRQDARRRRIPGDLRIVAGRASDPGEDRLVHRHPGRRRGRFGEGRDLPPWDHAHPRSPRRGQQPRCPASSASSRWTTSR